MYSLRRLLVHALACVLLGQAPVWAQEPAAQKFSLTIDNIMRGADLVGYEPNRVYWSQDSQRVYFRWKRAGEPRLKDPDLYVVKRDGTGLRKLTEDEAKLAPPLTGELSKDKTRTVFAEEGDVWLFDHAKNERRRLTETNDGESAPHFTADQQSVYFTRNNNLFVMPLNGGALKQLTDIRTGGGDAAPPLAFGGGGRRSAESADGSDDAVPGAVATGLIEVQQQPADPKPADPKDKKLNSQETLKQEERELLEAVRERAKDREEREAKRKAQEKRKPFDVPSGQGVANLTLTRDGKYVMASVIQSATGSKSAIVPNYITESAYTEDIPARTKVGDTQGRNRIAIINTDNGEVKYVEHGQKANAPEGSKDGKAADREVQLTSPQFSEDGQSAALLARAADNKDRWVLSLDVTTGKTKVIDHLHDDAWIGGPGAFTLGWLADNQTVYFQSEKDGWAHLYSHNITTRETKQLTSGKFEVSETRLAQDKSKFFFTSSEASLHEQHLYSMPVSGGERTRLTTNAGKHDVTIAPDESLFADVHSYANKPPELYLTLPVQNARLPVRVTISPTAEWSSHNWIDPPIVTFKARDGAEVPARIYKPANLEARRPGSLVRTRRGLPAKRTQMVEQLFS